MGELMALVAQTFILDFTDKGLMAKHFRHCVKILVSKVSCFQLGYPRDHSRLGDGTNIDSYYAVNARDINNYPFLLY